MSVLLIFIDGLGIGKRGESNPLAMLSSEVVAPLAVFQDEQVEIINEGVLIRTNATLGIEGRPQSASGQTTILTGVNVPQTLGYHKQGFPNAAMREIIAEHSIFLQLEDLGIEPNVFANAYTPQFFESEPRWKSATTCAVEASNVRFKTLDDLRENNALFHDFTNSILRGERSELLPEAVKKIMRSFDVEPRTPEFAGEILANIASKHSFTLYEYFITDKIGHLQSHELANEIVPQLAAFVRSVFANVDLNETTVFITSDHGNIEDLSIKTHTLNEVPTIVWGKHKNIFAESVKSLADITPTIVKVLQEI
ncbi:MAG: hypothetical protein H7Z37_03865 [Pyrinomonadaceae bacterium]|nr:hypothetical protein [Pyrinomonadaceae bacterium]